MFILSKVGLSQSYLEYASNYVTSFLSLQQLWHDVEFCFVQYIRKKC